MVGKDPLDKEKEFCALKESCSSSCPCVPLVKHGLQVCLEHDGHEVAAAAADVDGEVPDAELPVQHDPLLRGAQPVRHLKFSVPLIRFESYLKIIKWVLAVLINISMKFCIIKSAVLICVYHFYLLVFNHFTQSLALLFQ